MEGKVQWTRRELKKRSKAVLHTHYWRIVLVVLLLSLLMDGNKTPVSLIESAVQEQSGVSIQDAPKSSSLGLASTYQAIRDWVMEKQYVCQENPSLFIPYPSDKTNLLISQYKIGIEGVQEAFPDYVTLHLET